MFREAKHLSSKSSAGQMKTAEFRAALARWYRREGRHSLPWRQTRDPYAVLVSEFMLQQTQVVTVLPYYNRWLRRFPDFESVAHASEEEILHAWQGLGYYSRARNLHATAKFVMEKWRGRFPPRADEILSLPGAGRYTANAIATFAFDQSVPIVDANIARILTRLSNLRVPIDTAGGRDALWKMAAFLLPKRQARNYNSALMDLGALVCVSRQPKCDRCPVRRFCQAKEPSALPRKKAQPAQVRLIENHSFHFLRGRVLLERSSRRWRGMWILPQLSRGPTRRRVLHVSEFPFTHHCISLQVFSGQKSCLTNCERRWFSQKALSSIPIPSPHRRALAQLLAGKTQKLCSSFPSA